MNERFKAHVRRKVRRQMGMRALLWKHKGWDANVAWLEAHQSLLHHRKTNRAIALLKCDRHKFIGHMFQLWWWALDNVTPDGSFGDLLPAEIADAAGWPVKHGETFINALIAAGFIDENGDDGLRIHKWEDYTGLLTARREAGRKGGLASAEARRKQTASTVEAPLNGGSTPTNQPHLTSPTNQPTGPTGLPSRALLEISPLEVQKLRALFPNADINARHRDWVSWIEEEARKGRDRMPDDKMAAFHGWLKKDDGQSGHVLREITEPYGTNAGVPSSAAAAR